VLNTSTPEKASFGFAEISTKYLANFLDIPGRHVVGYTDAPLLIPVLRIMICSGSDALKVSFFFSFGNQIVNVFHDVINSVDSNFSDIDPLQSDFSVPRVRIGSQFPVF
jgi:hypothetical protein